MMQVFNMHPKATIVLIVMLVLLWGGITQVREKGWSRTDLGMLTGIGVVIVSCLVFLLR